MGQILPSSPEEEWSSPFSTTCSNVCLELILFSFGCLEFVFLQQTLSCWRAGLPYPPCIFHVLLLGAPPE